MRLPGCSIFKTDTDEIEAAIGTARKLVAITPLDEPAHARLIELYAAQGRQGLAEAQYRRVADLLRRDLDQAPGEAIEIAIADARQATPVHLVRTAGRPAQPDSKEPEDRPRRATPGRRTGWTAVATGGAMLLLLVGGLTLYGDRIGEIGDGDGDQTAEWELPVEPSIAVLPFESLGDDPEQTFFADGLTNDIITDLSKFSTLFVIASDSTSRYKAGAAPIKDVARDLGVRYVLKGSVQPVESGLVIDANLVDATTGRQIWGEHYERPAENLFATQKEITQTIVSVVGSGRGELLLAEIERMRRIPTQDLHAYGLFVRGYEAIRQETREGNALAREMFEKAIESDPNYARATAECSLAYLYDVFQGWTDSPAEWLQRAGELAQRAIKLDQFEPWGFVALGVFYQANARNEEAISLFETAYELNPNDYGVNMALGYAVTYGGLPERGVEVLEKAERLNPYNTGEPTVLLWAYFFSHRYEDALATTKRITRRHTHTYWIYKAAIHAELNQMDEARAAVAEILKLDSSSSVQSEHQRRLALGLAPANAEHLSNALRKAGLPE